MLGVIALARSGNVKCLAEISLQKHHQQTPTTTELLYVGRAAFVTTVAMQKYVLVNRNLVF